MSDETVEFIDWDTLVTWGAPTHMMKEWGGIVDPVNPMDQPLLRDQIEKNEIHEADYHFLGKIKNATQFVDVGGNCGQSINSYRLLNKTAQIVSFEPNPICYRILSAYTAEIPNLRTYPFGLSDSNAFLDLYTPVVDRLLITPLATTQREIYTTGWGLDWFAKNRHDRKIALYKEKLAFFQGDALDLRPSILKVDVEGAEMFTFRGFLNTIVKHRPIIMAENTHHPDFIEFFARIEYGPWQWDGHKLKQFDPNNWHRWGKAPDNTIYIHNDDVARHAQENGFDLEYLI